MNTDTLIEIANSRSSEMDMSLVEVQNPSVEVSGRDAQHLMMHGTLREQKRFVQNQNVKIKRNPILSSKTAESDDSSEKSL
jgi:S-adenosylmethionine:diacylglycerol 3-amino-3-carboxypropyl transferase